MQILVELAELQDSEVGDGTTSVVIIAAELLKRANVLVRNKIHPTSIISGYRLAMRESCKYIEDHLSQDIEKLGKETLLNCAKTSLSSKVRTLPVPFCTLTFTSFMFAPSARHSCIGVSWSTSL